jgi:FHA domain
MFGHLVPCGGGQAVALSKPRLILRLKREAGAYPVAPDVELRFLDGWWHVRKIDSGCLLEVNGTASAACRLNPNDVLNISGKFYRITFEAPASEPETPVVAAAVEPVAPAAKAGPPPTKAVRDVELGLLVPCGGGPAIVLRKPSIVIGRSSGCDVVLPFPFVSSRHCSLEWSQGYWQMTDLDSKNGTTVDGMAYHQKWILPGSILGLMGKRFQVDYQPQGERPSLADDDEAVLPTRSLMKLSGCTDQRLDKLLRSKPEDEVARPRWTLDN